jgi:hypothetical protein
MVRAKKIARACAPVAWIGVTSVLLSRFWFDHPDSFPDLPLIVWLPIDRALGPLTSDQTADAELLIVFAAAIAATSAATFAALWLWRRLSATPKTSEHMPR